VADLDFVTRRTDVALATIMARKGVSAEQIGAVLGLQAPTSPAFVRNGSLELIGTGLGTWLAINDTPDADWPAALKQKLAGLAAVADQSSGYTVLRFSGPKSRALLQRGVAIDLDPTVFGVGCAATSLIAHIGVIFWQVDDAPNFDLAIFRSYEDSFRHWIETAVATL
jgi:sarcosine oxidase subunit gamma